MSESIQVTAFRVPGKTFNLTLTENKTVGGVITKVKEEHNYVLNDHRRSLITIGGYPVDVNHKLEGNENIMFLYQVSGNGPASGVDYTD